jgi:hypothetical protein
MNIDIPVLVPIIVLIGVAFGFRTLYKKLGLKWTMLIAIMLTTAIAITAAHITSASFFVQDMW